jgi:hypothetical protein
VYPVGTFGKAATGTGVAVAPGAGVAATGVAVAAGAAVGVAWLEHAPTSSAPTTINTAVVQSFFPIDASS